MLYIKAYLRVLSEQIQLKQNHEYLDTVEFILKLEKITETYPYSTDHIKIVLNACLGKIHKNYFLQKLSNTIRSTKDSYLTAVKNPFEDLPLNSSLVNLPVYS